MSMYPMFAHYARSFGIEAAIERMSGASLDTSIPEFARRFKDDQSRIEEGSRRGVIEPAGWRGWYPGPLDDDVHWNSLKERFESDGWDEGRVGDVDTASNVVVAHTPRPDQATWNAKGLVVGYVQSGKTTNFLAVAAKLADVNYKLIIVLGGIHNGLRSQTQQRLDSYLRERHPDKWLTLTTAEEDFKKLSFDSGFLAQNQQKVALAVVKKNAAVLKKLIQWVDTPSGRKAMHEMPVLVIDDEADQASVATGRINPLIRKLLGLFPKCTYVGYTATPFANVFIDPENTTDLYPNSFILNLPRPTGYFGPEMIFGRDGTGAEEWQDGIPPDGYDMVRLVPEDDVSLLRPGARDDADTFVPAMTDDLVAAVRWFWLSTAARRARGDHGHSTMLIHTSVKIAVHESFKAPLDRLRREAIDDLLRDPRGASWRRQWDHETARVPQTTFGRSATEFVDVLHHLPAVLEQSRVVLDNYRSSDRLVYPDPPADPVVAIAVGGNTLSRGLTLEGLVVSFFVRAAQAYDTLLQMGRWFGYRPGYEDLPRIWTTPNLASAFRHLALVEHEMRDDIDRYQRENLTPEDVAVRVRTHPSLRITAKMGAAQSAYVSYAGRRMQTRYFLTDDALWLRSNHGAGETLIVDALRAGVLDATAKGALLVRDVPVNVVQEFLRNYHVHEDSPDLDPDMMRLYIEQQLIGSRPALQKWSVAVVNGECDPVSFGGQSVKPVKRARLNDKRTDRADIKTLMSKEDRVLDLGIGTVEARRLSEAALVERRNDDPVHADRGLVVLYVIDRMSAPDQPDQRGPLAEPARLPLNAGRDVIGFGIVFPGAPASRKVDATKVAVNLAGLEVERDDEGINEALDVDTEGAK